jgi:hypothetical protein
MAVTAETLAEVQQHIEAGQIDSSRFAALKSAAQVLAYVYREAKEDGEEDEVALDRCELIVRSSAMSPDEVRKASATLRSLGFGALSGRLRQIAGRRTLDLRPLVGN